MEEFREIICRSDWISGLNLSDTQKRLLTFFDCDDILQEEKR
jgi:hypothetical protein